ELATVARPRPSFPIRAAEAAVLRRAGHTEAAVDLTRLAGLHPVAVVCEIMRPDGRMARVPELLALARKHRLAVITVADLIAYRRQRERLVERIAQTRLPTRWGDFQLHLYEARPDGDHQIPLDNGNDRTSAPVLARIHSQCLTG